MKPPLRKRIRRWIGARAQELAWWCCDPRDAWAIEYRIDGRLKGKIVSDNTLIIGESGQVDADIDCGVVSIRGTVSGRVHGRQRIELLAGSKVQATLISPKLVIEDGAFFQGDCQMGSPPKGAFLPAGGGGS